MSRGTRFPVLVLALALLASISGPYFSVRSLVCCMDPSDCAAMHDLCDRNGMTSHDSCCKVGNDTGSSLLPATLKFSFGPAPVLSPQGSVVPAALPTLPAGLAPAVFLEVSPRSSPSSVSILRI